MSSSDPASASAGASSEEPTAQPRIPRRRSPRLARRATLDTGMGFRVSAGDWTGGKLWRSFPEDLLEMVFARLPVRTIVELIRDSHAWSIMSKSATFRRTCVERHPCSLPCLMRWDAASAEGGSVRATVYDHESKEWAGFDLVGLPPSAAGQARHDYGDSMYGHDSGLVCFVPPGDLSVAHVLVCNPLTGDWRSLPLVRHEHRPTVMVQLLADDDTKTYRVMLVSGHHRTRRDCVCEAHAPELTARRYDSATGAWSLMDTGWVYGSCGTLQGCRTSQVPRAFDCERKVMYHEKYNVPFTHPYGWSFARDGLVVLCTSTCGIWEFGWHGSYTVKRVMPMCPIPIRGDPPHGVHIFSSTHFIVVINNVMDDEGNLDVIVQMWDRSTDQWVVTSSMPAAENLAPSVSLQRTFSCELRWDAIP
ncbi:hypothetical protein KC19_VG001100 [Ceratodon purpureus]|uniref:F-box domain-containing protein n=1 Tax=Ceratodon purpureus TaxID=3225 RepID=A0A8T0HKE4_CERPU|nr:hypothetical protein KC19_6G224900 [Ceratodon purpureus]KAG0571311.1 hypothetical protein KC19_VG001100 [Ceratodon purpureus]